VGQVIGVESYVSLAEAAAERGVATEVEHALTALGLTASERADLTSLVAGRTDPAGALLTRVAAARSLPAGSSFVSGHRPYTTDQMDAAISLANTLRRTPALELDVTLRALQREPIAALPPDEAGRLIADLVDRLAELGDPAQAGRAANAIAGLSGMVPSGRLPVDRIVQAVISLHSLATIRDALAQILSRTSHNTLAAGCAVVLRTCERPRDLVDLIDAVAAITNVPATAMPVPATAMPVPAPSRPRIRWRGGNPFRRGQRAEPPMAPAEPTMAGTEPDATGSTPAGANVAPQSRTAYPHLAVDGHQGRPDVVVLETPFDVAVGLARYPDSPLTTMSGALTMLATEVVELEVVLVYDPKSLVPTGETRRILTVTDASPFPVTTFTFTAQFLPEVSERRIGAHYLRDGQIVAVAWRSFVTVESADQVAAAEPPKARESSLLDLTPLLGSDAPDLIVAVHRADDAAANRFVWSAYPAASGVAVPDAPRTAVMENLAEFAQETRRQIQFNKGPDGNYLELAGRGRRIANAIPDGIRDALRAVAEDQSRTVAATVLLLTEELDVPWELAAFKPALSTGFGGESAFLGAHVAIARWPLTEHRPRPAPRPSVPVRTSAVVTADYTGISGWTKLENAQSEAAEVANMFTPPAVTIAPSLWSVIDLLRGNPQADVLHVALHGQFDAQGNQEGIVLIDEQAGGARSAAFLTPAAIENGELTSGPFVFLNACQVGSDERVLGDYGGLASTLLRIGAAGVVAPLWNIDDDVAREVASEFYTATLADPAVPVTELMRRIRARYTEAAVRARKPGVTPTLISYQVFGHPRLRLARGAAT